MSSSEHRLELRWISDGGTTRISVPAGWTAPTVTKTGPVSAVPTGDPSWLDFTAPAGTTVAVTVAKP